ncbi:MAG: hypothetical protein WAU88_04130 [Candidatus Zixiibacteriota bacterium]
MIWVFQDILFPYVSLENLVFTVISLVVGGLISYFFYRKSIRRGKVRVFGSPAIQLFDSIVKEIPSIEILYKSATINKSLALLNVTFFNDGPMDIEIKSTAPEVTIELPQELEWCEFNIRSYSKGVVCSVKLTSKSTAGVRWDLLRRGEVINCVALVRQVADLQPSHSKVSRESETLDPWSVLKIHHRIANTTFSKQELTVGDERESLRRFEPLLFGGVLVLGICTFLLGQYIAYWDRLDPSAKIDYTIGSSSDQRGPFRLLPDPIDSTAVRVLSLASHEELKIAKSSFSNDSVHLQSIAPQSRRNGAWTWLPDLLFGLLMVCLPSLGLVRSLRRIRTKRRISRAL